MKWSRWRVDSSVMVRAVMRLVEELIAVAEPRAVLELPLGIMITLALKSYAGCRINLPKEVCMKEIFGTFDGAFNTAFDNLKDLVAEVDGFDHIDDLGKLIEFMEKIAIEGEKYGIKLAQG